MSKPLEKKVQRIIDRITFPPESVEYKYLKASILAEADKAQKESKSDAEIEAAGEKGLKDGVNELSNILFKE